MLSYWLHYSSLLSPVFILSAEYDVVAVVLLVNLMLNYLTWLSMSSIIITIRKNNNWLC